ncbi:MAG: reductive dehalogenase [Candidatus Bathyarchaeia archaeon]
MARFKRVVVDRMVPALRPLGIRTVDRPTYRRFIVGRVERFDQSNTAFDRTKWDTEFKRRLRESCEPGCFFLPLEKPAYKFPSTGLYIAHSSRAELRDWENAALYDASWKVYEDMADCWDGPVNPERLPVPDPSEMSERVKRAARLFGADLVGVCVLDQRWVYRYERGPGFYRDPPSRRPSRIPHKYAISIGVEMDYEMHKTSPSYLENVATGIGYSKMRIITTQLAQYIRGIGYPAYAHGNERVLNIPIAIDAGLGELGRNGLLITPQFGPRVRLCSVTTDLPLKPDKPIDIGIQGFCEKCERCAKMCPAQAIKHGRRTATRKNVSNRGGIMRWPVDAERCLAFWGANKAEWQNCGVCISVCPWNEDGRRVPARLRRR